MFPDIIVSATIHEHRAPTDESVKLLDELKKKAFDSIVESITVETNTFKGRAFLYRDVASFDSKICYKFNINGKDYEGCVTVKDYEYTDKVEMIKALFKAVSEEITKMLLFPIIEEKFNTF